MSIKRVFTHHTLLTLDGNFEFFPVYKESPDGRTDLDKLSCIKNELTILEGIISMYLDLDMYPGFSNSKMTMRIVIVIANDDFNSFR